MDKYQTYYLGTAFGAIIATWVKDWGFTLVLCLACMVWFLLNYSSKTSKPKEVKK